MKILIADPASNKEEMDVIPIHGGESFTVTRADGAEIVEGFDTLADRLVRAIDPHGVMKPDDPRLWLARTLTEAADDLREGVGDLYGEWEDQLLREPSLGHGL